MPKMRIKERAHYAQKLARIAMQLQRTPEDKQAGLLAAADSCLSAYKLARISENEPTNETISPEVGEGLEDALQALANVIGDTLKPLGFALLAFSVEGDGPRTSYVSNCNRDDMAKAMAEFIAAHELGK